MTRHPSRAVATCALLFLAGGCGGRLTDGTGGLVGEHGADAGETDVPAFDGAVALDGGPAFEASSPDAGSDASRCPSDVIFMAVQAQDGSGTTLLETFAPATGTVTRLGPIPCAGPSAPVIALAVDATGAIYLNIVLGRLQRLDTTTFECEPPLPVPTQGWPPRSNGYLGLAFVGESAGDVLYADFAGSQSLGTIDVDSGAIQASPEGAGLQLAGTGDGRLFIVNDDETQSGDLAELDPTTGAVVRSYAPQDPPGSLFVPSAQPIAFWGGNLYMFAYDIRADAGDSGSVINRLDMSDDTVATVATVPGGAVVGANAAPCPPSP